jgi:hypothetical protein
MGISQTKISQPHHPYYPTNITLPGYVPNTLTFTTLFSGFGAAVIVLFIFTYIITKWRRPNISTPDILKVLWFILCTFPAKSIHPLTSTPVSNQRFRRFPSHSVRRLLHSQFLPYLPFAIHPRTTLERIRIRRLPLLNSKFNGLGHRGYHGPILGSYMPCHRIRYR